MAYKLPSSLYITNNDPHTPRLTLEGFYGHFQHGIAEHMSDNDNGEFNRRFRLLHLAIKVHRLVRSYNPKLYARVKEFFTLFEQHLDYFRETPKTPSIKSLSKNEIESIEVIAPFIDQALLPPILALCKLENNFKDDNDNDIKAMAESMAQRSPYEKRLPITLFNLDNPWKAYRLTTYNHRRKAEIEAERIDWEASCELEDYYTSKREWRILCQGMPIVEDEFLSFDLEDSEPDFDLSDLWLEGVKKENPTIDQILHPQLKRLAEDHSPASHLV